MEFPTIDKFAKDVAEKALDEFIYDGKTIREWVEIIAKQESCEDCISREAVLEILEKEEFKGDAIYEIEKKLPPVTPTRPTGKWIAGVDRWGDIATTVNGYRCSECCAFNADKDNFCPNCGAKMEVDDNAE